MYIDTLIKLNDALSSSLRIHFLKEFTQTVGFFVILYPLYPQASINIRDRLQRKLRLACRPRMLTLFIELFGWLSERQWVWVDAEAYLTCCLAK